MGLLEGLIGVHSVGRQGLAAWFVVAAGRAGGPSGFIVALHL